MTTVLHELAYVALTAILAGLPLGIWTRSNR